MSLFGNIFKCFNICEKMTNYTCSSFVRNPRHLSNFLVSLKFRIPSRSWSNSYDQIFLSYFLWRERLKKTNDSIMVVVKQLIRKVGCFSNINTCTFHSWSYLYFSLCPCIDLSFAITSQDSWGERY